MILLTLLCGFMCACSTKTENASVIKKYITEATVEKAIAEFNGTDPVDDVLLKKGIEQLASLWQTEDGSEEDFVSFCKENFIADPKEKEAFFLKTSEYLEQVFGHYNQMSLELQRNVHENTGALMKIDEAFAAYNPQTHLIEDLYANKIAFIIALNFPKRSLEEKETLGEDRLSWAYARLGDIFTERIPADLMQAYSKASSDADVYIANYNIYAGNLLNKDGKKIFPENMILLSHWNLRDEIKADYALGEEGVEKQEMIYEVMKRIISQEIPREAINSGQYDWNPYENILINEKEESIAGTPEGVNRYQIFLNNFIALKHIDEYTGNTYIDRKFSDEMEIAVEDSEAILREFLAAPELKELGALIKERVGRDLRPYDIWYDGFKPRSNMNEDHLSVTTRRLYPDAKAFDKDIPNVLMKLGYQAARAHYIAEKITVDATRGSGHAWGAAYKGQQSHLRTRIPEGGMDYKGYNIAMHELGHNVEQTISLYDMDYYMLNGVPNTAFTEALAFIFQKRDLDVLGVKDNTSDKDIYDLFDKAWQLYEIAGVSLLDISVWKWLYANPNATAEQLKETVIRLSKEVWNEYYAPVYGIQDEPILGIYSHMVSYPLYLTAYAFGQIIEFQIEQYIKDKAFATEVDRIYMLGRLTPNQWMRQATGSPLSTESMLVALRKALAS